MSEAEQARSAFIIEIAEDRLSASVTISEYFPELSITAEQLTKALNQHGIQTGILEEVIGDVVSHPIMYIDQPVIVAQGRKQQDGTDSKVDYVYKDTNVKKGPVIRDDGRVDYHEVNQIENVTSGQLLVVKTPATKGTNGIGVDGRVLPAKDGKDRPLVQGKNVQLSDDKLQLTSLIDGQVSITENKVVNVFPLYEVNGDVDFSVGNINFLGSIVIRGNVLPGFKITAAGDIRVQGSVEGAELKAEGAIEVAVGIIGHNKACIMAGTDIKTTFAQEATLIAKQDVTVAQSILHCNVQSGGIIKCMGAKGLVVGGRLQANLGLMARTIGNSLSTSTIIEIGAMPDLRVKLNAVMESLAATHTNIEKTEQAIKLLELMLQSQGSLPPEKQALLIKLVNTRSVLMHEIATLEDKRIELELSWQEADKASVIASSVIHSGTKVTIGKAIKYIISDMTNCHLVLEGGDVINTSEGEKRGVRNDV